MRQDLFVQDGGDGVHDHCDNHLVDSLRSELGPTYEIRYPVMPNEADARFQQRLACGYAGNVRGLTDQA